MADIIGRKKIFVTTAVLICLGSFGSACCGNAPTFTVYGQLAIWRCVSVFDAVLSGSCMFFCGASRMHCTAKRFHSA